MSNGIKHLVVEQIELSDDKHLSRIKLSQNHDDFDCDKGWLIFDDNFKDVFRQMCFNSSKLSEISVTDLLFTSEECVGVYIFSTEKDIMYIGKCSSRPLVDRIGGHLTPRRRDYMNCLVKRVYEKLHHDDYVGMSTNGNNNCLTPDVIEKIKDFRLSFISVVDKSDSSTNAEFQKNIGILERALIELLNPHYQ